ncbi:MAG: hypothetical protein IT335_06025 [Thermomicrobiales bacterium]|nr:hypothetical protein [Thermomicrobiales bacterium]
MVNRADLRSQLRRRLEDTTGTPLWDDATLNELLADALSHYGIRFPAERTVSVVVSAGDTTVPVDSSVTLVVAVRDGNGTTQPSSRHSSGEGGRQTWRWWNGAVVLTSPAAAGTWEIDCLGHRILPGNDSDPAGIRPGDEEIVVLLAASSALLRRAVELSKRGAETGGLTLTRVADRHTQQAELLIQARRRRATGGWLST